ncbi:hypothetical protein ATANTOWER_031031 [Ataeniobius toweri]|uniref:Uncharacterized protein n=1 Tax=Ataeniobius toweri TaxID=208326 RepID=A0ABU7AMC0_9TELE|nr:hypothetical protein [Ataeniobius toweri]
MCGRHRETTQQEDPHVAAAAAHGGGTGSTKARLWEPRGPSNTYNLFVFGFTVLVFRSGLVRDQLLKIRVKPFQPQRLGAPTKDKPWICKLNHAESCSAVRRRALKPIMIFPLMIEKVRNHL